MTDSIQESISIKRLLSENQYKIPVYQRNFDWSEPQIQQLIDDIQDYAEKGDDATVYYIGSLVIHEKAGQFEILDGQQRFTTLCLLAIYLKYRLPNRFDCFKKPNLSFESRSKSEFTINKLFDIFCKEESSEHASSIKLPELISTIDTKKANPSIIEGFKAIDRVIAKKFGDNKDGTLLKFANYLMQQVKILPVLVPKNTDVTHYFEVMNNRGEQLEKHEVVKANLLSVVQKDEQAMATINKVWLACADMSRYVQLGFSVEERKAIFDENFLTYNFESLTKKINIEAGDPNSDLAPSVKSLFFTFEQTLSKGTELQLKKDKSDDGKIKADNSDEGKSERFTSVIDFPNFLMQVLRIYMLSEFNNGVTHIVKTDLPALDDKELIKAFEKITKNDASEVKKFIYILLKLRYLFDHYIVKRERGNSGEDWSLKRYKFEDNSSSYVNSFGVDGGDTSSENWRCMTLLSAFHVSYPTNSRKNWLSAVLYWLNKKEDKFSAIDYLQFLESLAKAFMVNRYLNKTSKEYTDFIYILDEIESIDLLTEDFRELLSYGKVTVFVFNYLDYLIWKDPELLRDKKSKFSFSFKSSVEHFSPQTPKANERLDVEMLHGFGNLCLMTNTDNSSLGNDGPKQKADILMLRNSSMAPLSLKLELMITKLNDQEWSDVSIEKHEEEMFNVLKAGLERIL